MAGLSDSQYPHLDPLIRALLRPEAYDHPVRQFDVLETHISWVILTGDIAYKLKKPVNYGFVDFTTLAQRKFCCEEELRLNRRQTTDLYLAVKPIYSPRECPSFHGTGEPIEYAVQMRQFSQSDLLPEVLSRGDLTPEHLDQLAREIAEFQQQAAVATETDAFGTIEIIRDVMLANFSVVERVPALSETVRQIRAWADKEFDHCAPVFSQRKADGQVREGHGDLHLGNMILRRGRIEVFDCLEFNPGLRWIDVISEVAFLVMDLADRGRPDLGWRFLNAWLQQTGDHDGLKVWAWYFCYRALVRAKVAVLRRQQSDVTDQEARLLDQQLNDYLQLARTVVQRPPPTLVITYGVSGSGKSYWAKRMAQDFGAIWVRSDVERKRLFEIKSEHNHLEEGLYSSEMTAQTYQHLKHIAATILQNGWSVIVDATFLQHSLRTPFRDLARELGVNGCLAFFQADEDTLKARILSRQQVGVDPSDATIEVLKQQLLQQQLPHPSEGWTIITVDSNAPNAGENLTGALENQLGWKRLKNAIND